jgi:acetolactate synthase-1/2/3 large subunit
MTVARAIVSSLRAAGTRAIFGVPGGGGNLDLIDAAGRAGLPFVLTATETAGALAAIAQAEMTGAPGACLTTIGPGVTSVVNGVACASLERAPLVVITDAPADSAYPHQRVDQRALLAPVVKYAATVSATRVAVLLDQAIARAMAPPAGPVHVLCPGDVAGQQATARTGPLAHARVRRPASRLPAVLARHLARARRPLLIVGLGARRPDDAAAIRALCHTCRVPALVTYKAKGVVADDDEWFAGVFTNGAIEREIVCASDVVIGVGLDPVELLPRPWPAGPLVVSCAASRFDTRHVPFAAQWITPVASGVRAMAGALRRSDWVASRARSSAEAQRAAVRQPGRGLTPSQVVDAAARHLGPVVSQVTVDAGAHMFPATTLWPAREPNDLLISNGLSTMGFALPAAIGAALLDRERPVAAITGDGGLLMCAGELLTAARERLRVITIVLADASLSLIEIKQVRRRLPPSGVALGQVDWCAMASSVGVEAHRAETAAELDRALTRARAHPGPSLVDARVDRSTYAAMLQALRG